MEPGPTEIAPNSASHLLRPALRTYVLTFGESLFMSSARPDAAKVDLGTQVLSTQFRSSSRNVLDVILNAVESPRHCLGSGLLLSERYVGVHCNVERVLLGC